VVTDIDLVTSYVAGSAACIGVLLSTAGLESAPASFDQPVSWNADRLNPLPPDAPDGGDR